jgi:hypothetical protein
VIIRLSVDGTAEVIDPQDLRRLHVEAPASGQGRLQISPAIGEVIDDGSGDVWIVIEWIGRRVTETGEVSPQWPDELSAMIEFARGKGWLSDDGRSVRGHVEWVD